MYETKQTRYKIDEEIKTKTVLPSIPRTDAICREY